MYWGGTIKGAVYGEGSDAPRNQRALQAFESDAGKKITVINTGQAWASFDTATMQAAIEAGAIPLVTMGLPEGVTLEEVAAGAQDAQIRAWAQQAKAWGYPFLFRPWWEMNGDWYRWGRDPSFVAAWRHFHDLVEEEGAHNVTWAWIVNAVWWDPESDPTPYYPGDDYVDWVGMDAYNWGRNPIQPDRWATPEQTIGPTLDLLEQIAPGKPVCICEDASTEIGGNKESWIHDMLHSYLPQQPEIKAYLWFNWNIEQNGGRWDWPIESSATAQEAFREGIQSSVYLSSLPPLRPLAKVPLPAGPAEAPWSPPGPVNPPLADGSWSQAEDVSSAAVDARDADVAVAPDGTATVAWVQYDGSDYVVRERRLGPGGSPQGPVHELSAPGRDALEPEVAVAPDGAASVVWKRFDGSTNVVQERRIGPGGSPEQAAHDLSATGHYAGQPQVAATPDGGAFAVWERFSGYRTVIQERRIAPSGVPGTAHDLSDGEQNAVEPRVAAGPDGSATVVWDRFDGSGQIVQERRVSGAGVPEGETRDLSAAGAGAVEPALSIGPEGVVTVAWTRSDGQSQVVQERRLSPAGLPEPDVNDASPPGEPAVEPKVDTGPDGTTTLVWQGFDGSHEVIQERRIAPDGLLEPGPRDLSAEGEDAHDPQVLAGGDGAATVAWDRSDGSNTVIQARRVLSSGAPDPVTVNLSAGGGDAGAAAIDGNQQGAVAVVWRRFDGANDTVQAAAFSPFRAQPGAGYEGGGTATAALLRVPSNRFRFGRVRLERRGTATVSISVPGPGTMWIGARGARLRLDGGRGLSTATAHRASIAAPCTLRVRIVPVALTRRRLAKDGRARIRLRARYAPTGGVPRIRELDVALRASPG